MGRAKGSPEFLKIARTVANAITCSSPEDNLVCPVYCKGKQSVFAAVSRALPTLVRSKHDTSASRHAISEVELNKVLAQEGYVSCRRRNRIQGSRNKWETGFRYWKERRWCDSLNAIDVAHMHSHLAQLNLPASEYSRVFDALVNFLRLQRNPAQANSKSSTHEEFADEMDEDEDDVDHHTCPAANRAVAMPTVVAPPYAQVPSTAPVHLSPTLLHHNLKLEYSPVATATLEAAGSWDPTILNLPATLSLSRATSGVDLPCMTLSLSRTTSGVDHPCMTLSLSRTTSATSEYWNDPADREEAHWRMVMLACGATEHLSAEPNTIATLAIASSQLPLPDANPSPAHVELEYFPLEGDGFCLDKLTGCEAQVGLSFHQGTTHDWLEILPWKIVGL